MNEILIIIILFTCFCLGFFIIHRINKNNKEQLNNTNDYNVNEIKIDDIDNIKKDESINDFYTERPTIIFNDMFQYSEPWRNQLNNDKNNLLR